MAILRKLLLVFMTSLFIIGLGAGLSACPDNDAENAADKAADKADEAADKASDAAEKAGDAADKADDKY